MIHTNNAADDNKVIFLLYNNAKKLHKLLKRIFLTFPNNSRDSGYTYDELITITPLHTEKKKCWYSMGL